jgi:hypothetical protein
MRKGARFLVEKTVWIRTRDIDWGMAEFGGNSEMDATPLALNEVQLIFGPVVGYLLLM